MLRIVIDTEFVVVATEVLHECRSCTDHPCRPELVQIAHGPQPGFQSIGLDRVGVLLGDVAGG
jgi:hypothetical protein